MRAPMKAAMYTTSSSLPGTYIMLRYDEYMTWPPRYAITASDTPAMAERPEVMPSRPSLRLAPLLVADTRNMVMMMNTIQPPVSAPSPIQPVSHE